MVDLGIAEGILEEMSSGFALKTLAGFPQSREGLSESMAMRVGYSRIGGGGSGALGCSGRGEEPNARPRDP